MYCRPLRPFKRLSATAGIRPACLIFAVAVMFAGSANGLVAGQLETATTFLGPNSRQPVPQREVNSENLRYAQLFWPFERNFYYGPRTSPRQNFESGPPPDEKFASETKRKVIEQLRAATPPPPTTGPLLLIVSITKQTVTLYDAGVVVVESPISSGTSENPTPTGIFSVIEKNWWHRSNIYSAAPMPYMQRINWEGVALHAGELPGYPASHGCVRLPYDFALRLWQTTKIGTRVIITHDDVAPIEISHPRLFAPEPEEERLSVAKEDAKFALPDDPEKDSNTLTSSSSNISSSSPAYPSYPPRSFLAPATPQGAMAAPAGATDRVFRPGPISILVSQRDQRMYVRKGLEPIYDFPVVIRNSGRSLGTHVFSAVAQSDDSKTLRWMVVSMPSTLPGVSTRAPAKSQLLAAAKEALDRLEFPKEAVDQVSALISVGASLIITDRGLGRQASALDSDYMIATH
jgi:lipoprotein-anchoring transpeptidase ErfK/SrfK